MKFFTKSLLSVAAISLVLGVANVASAARGGIPGKPDDPGGGGGNKPPTEAVNNLSFPAVSSYLSATTRRWTPPEEPELGVTYSYGCADPEMMDQFSYPNTSCVDDLAAPTQYLDAGACTAEGAPCEGFPVSRIYWQKVTDNYWWAESEVGTPVTAAYLDWGDALEAVSWNERSVVRVETQPYGSQLVDSNGFFIDFDPSEGDTCTGVAEFLNLDPLDACNIGFEMWHVAGQGTTEQWGVRVDDTDPYLPYAYESPFRIIHTDTARLNLAKLVPESATCPEPGGNPNDPPPVIETTWSPDTGWSGTCEWLDAPYTTELSITGKYVYGYNWRMKTVELESICQDQVWDKTGYWRLTFYTTNDAVVFGSGDDNGDGYDDNPVLATTAPPTVTAIPTDLNTSSVVILSEEEEDTDALYIPVIDYENNLTYIDICITPKTQGGGGGGNPGGKPR